MQGYDLQEVVGRFGIMEEGKAAIMPYGNGHINDTYLVQTGSAKYILQRINHNVFKKPEQVMANIVLVTEHLQKKIIEKGGNPVRETLKFLKTVDGQDYYKTENGNYFRMYIYVDDVSTYQMAEKPEHLYNAARTFGRFQNDLADFPADTLGETIPNFHNTKARFENLRLAIQEDVKGRKNEVGSEIQFALQREKELGVIVDAIEAGEIPLRVTHNDTKINNILFDHQTDEGICVIDLDTVMPGSVLYDFGESIRTGASTALEDETNLDKVECSLALFEAFTQGFLEELGSGMTEKEIALLPFAVKLMTYENGIRFLTDYLSGDVYFKIHRPKHNLDRCRMQFKLVEDIESKMERMKEIVGR